MPRRTVSLISGEIYHVFNRGVEQRNIFLGKKDFERFKNLINYYQWERPSKFSLLPKNELTHRMWRNKKLKLLEIICYCLMPNHFHILLKQLEENDTSKFLRTVQNSYVKYFNLKYKRTGSLFEGRFRAVYVSTDEQLIHVSRYIHLNPIATGLVNDPKHYQWSSYPSYLNKSSHEFINKEIILSFFKTLRNYQRFVLFVLDNVDYA